MMDSNNYPPNMSTQRRKRGRPTLGEVERRQAEHQEQIIQASRRAANSAISLTPRQSMVVGSQRQINKPSALSELIGTDVAVVTKNEPDGTEIKQLRQEVIHLRAILQEHEVKFDLITRALAELAGLRK